MSENEATAFAAIAGLLGVAMMWYFFNFQSAMVSLFSLFLYGFIYTPLKKVNSISVLVGVHTGCFTLLNWMGCGNR